MENKIKNIPEKYAKAQWFAYQSVKTHTHCTRVLTLPAIRALVRLRIIQTCAKVHEVQEESILAHCDAQTHAHTLQTHSHIL